MLLRCPNAKACKQYSASCDRGCAVPLIKSSWSSLQHGVGVCCCGGRGGGVGVCGGVLPPDRVASHVLSSSVITPHLAQPSPASWRPALKQCLLPRPPPKSPSHGRTQAHHTPYPISLGLQHSPPPVWQCECNIAIICICNIHIQSLYNNKGHSLEPLNSLLL